MTLKRERKWQKISYAQYNCSTYWLMPDPIPEPGWAPLPGNSPQLLYWALHSMVWSIPSASVIHTILIPSPNYSTVSASQEKLTLP